MVPNSIATNPERAKRSLPTIALLVGLAAELYLLVGDLGTTRAPAPSRGADAPPIAELVTSRDAVRVQLEGELIWEEARPNQTLYRRQSLLTPRGGAAEVAFLDGTGIRVDENSLIVLEKSPSDDSPNYSRIVIRLLRGTLHKTAPRRTSDLLRRLGKNQQTPEIEVAAGQARIELTPSSELSITSRPEDPAGARVVVRSGEVKVGSSSGSTMVQAGEEARLPTQGGATSPPIARKLAFNLLSPKSGQSIEATKEVRPVRFRWNASRDIVAGTPQEIEVSRDPGFAQGGVMRTRIPAAEPPLTYVEINVNLPATLDATQWHWRVRAAESVSETQSFWTLSPTLPQPLYPADRARVRGDRAVELSWRPIDRATGYEVAIPGREPIQVTEAFVRVADLPPGATHWKVRARLKDGDVSPWGTARELIVVAVEEPQAPRVDAQAKDAPPPPPDELDEPEIRPAPATPEPGHSSLWDWLFRPAYAQAEKKPGQWLVHLKWKAVKGAKNYRVQVAKERTFAKIISEGETDKPEWDWNFKLGMQNRKGRAFFRVASVGAGGATGTYSKPKPISIPDSILADAQHSGQPETYAAVDDSPGALPVEGADAAPDGNLASAPRPVSVLPPKPLKLEVPPGTQPGTHRAATTPAPIPLSRADAPTPAADPQDALEVEIALLAGYGSLSQTSAATDITSVTPQSPFLQQRLSAAGEIARIRLELDAWMAGFSASDDQPNSSQAPFNAIGLRFNALRAWEKSADRWTLYGGITLDRSYRWIAATDGLSVTSQRALSLGPSGRAVRTYLYGNRGFLAPIEVGVAANLPLSGAWTSGQLGIEGRIWGEWSLAKLSQDGNARCLGLRSELEGAYLTWQSPASTNTVAWTLWFAPTLRF